MTGHWTYYPIEDSNSDLEQGDILRPTAALKKIVFETSPALYTDTDLGYLVITQSCDLVRRREKPPRAQHINLAVIKPLRQIVDVLLETSCRKIGKGIFAKETKAKGRDLLERLFNQNEQHLGLFYLHNDAEVEIAEAAVALLRVNLTVESCHYDEFVLARTGRLSSEFQAKLGWLVGYLYARPATQDWKKDKVRERELIKLINEYIKTQSSENGPYWVSGNMIEEASKKGVALDCETFPKNREELERAAQDATPKLAIKEIADQLAELLKEEAQVLELVKINEITGKLGRRLLGNGAFRALLKKDSDDSSDAGAL